MVECNNWHFHLRPVVFPLGSNLEILEHGPRSASHENSMVFPKARNAGSTVGPFVKRTQICRSDRSKSRIQINPNWDIKGLVAIPRERSWQSAMESWYFSKSKHGRNQIKHQNPGHQQLFHQLQKSSLNPQISGPLAQSLRTRPSLLAMIETSSDYPWTCWVHSSGSQKSKQIRSDLIRSDTIRSICLSLFMDLYKEMCMCIYIYICYVVNIYIYHVYISYMYLCYCQYN